MSNSFATSWTIAHEASLSMGFPRQELWGGLPFLPPRGHPDQGMNPCFLYWQADFFLPPSHLGVHIILVKVKVSITQSCPIRCDAMDCSSPGFSLHRIPQIRIQEWVAIPFSKGSLGPGIEPGSSTFQVDSLPSEPQGIFPNTIVLVHVH